MPQATVIMAFGQKGTALDQNGLNLGQKGTALDQNGLSLDQDGVGNGCTGELPGA